jgi:hypothetical protein
MVTSFPVYNPPQSDRNLHLASFIMTKSGYNVETVQDRQKMSLQHEDETMDAPSISDVTSGLK